VYLADDPILRRQLALKIPRGDTLSSRDLRGRFEREAQAVASLSHPNIVQVHDVGVDSEQSWIVSSYCRGGSLAQWLKGRDKPPPVRDTARLCAVLATAVHYVHDQGILHRDLKPSNVLFEPKKSETFAVDRCALGDVTPKISDFGLAKFYHGQDRTATGDILGTPAYMAPEQAEGRPDDVGPATDIYAIGAILYEMLVGKPPFLGQTDLDTLRELTSRQPIPPRKLRRAVPHDLEAICLKCLEFAPRHRYASGDELAVDLDRYLTGLPVRARPAGAISRLVKWYHRKPLVAGLTAALGLSMVVGFSLVTWQWQRTRMQHTRAQAARRW
jgi:serine/threonine protein kinase